MITVHLIDFSLPASTDETVYASDVCDQGFRVVQVPCYVCSGYAAEFAPLRRVLKTKTVNPHDPTEAFVLVCGHTVI